MTSVSFHTKTGESDEKTDSVWRALEALKDLLAGKNRDVALFSHLDIRQHFLLKDVVKDHGSADKLITQLQDQGVLWQDDRVRGYFTINLEGGGF